MWLTRETEEFARRLKQFGKKRPKELAAMLDNLDTYLKTLQSGVHPKQIRLGFTHAESDGAIAIDQKGTEGKPKQTRLYVYPDLATETLYLITIGDKASQKEDNATCRKLISDLKQLTQEGPKKEPRQERGVVSTELGQSNQLETVIYTEEIACDDVSDISRMRISHALTCTLINTAIHDKPFWSLQEISEETNGFIQMQNWPERVTPKEVEKLLKETPIKAFMVCESDMWRFRKEQVENLRFAIGHPELFGLPTRKRDDK